VARVSGLSKPTVSLALSGLLDGSLVREVGRSRGDRGPSAVLYEINPRAGWVVGIDVGRNWVRAALANITGTIVGRRDERARVLSQRTLVGQIGSIAHRLVSDASLDWSQVTQAALGSPGVFDPERGYVAMAPNLPGWGRHGLVEAVREQLGTNISFENDVNLAALAERDHGLGRNLRTFVLISIGTGIGLGLVIDGALYRGAHGAAGEIAYLPLGPGDPKDPANRRRGTFEEAAAAAGIVREGKRAGMRGPLTAETIFRAARKGNRTAVNVVEREAQRVALAIAAITPIIDPELVVLGGGVGRSADLLLEPIEQELRQLLPFRPKVAVSPLGDDAVLQGALAVALEAARERVFARPTRPLQEVAG
jgi:predicted NBD/HSP70 family sugar kinase